MPSEQAARVLLQLRRDLGVQYKNLTPAEILETICARYRVIIWVRLSNGLG